MPFTHNQNFTPENLDTMEMFMSDIADDISDLLIHLEMPAEVFDAYSAEFIS